MKNEKDLLTILMNLYAKQENITRFKKMEMEKIEDWSHEYTAWMKQRSMHKYTKASIKAFFETKQLKVSTLTIDAVKANCDK